jgi:hypothetical protein
MGFLLAGSSYGTVNAASVRTYLNSPPFSFNIKLPEDKYQGGIHKKSKKIL